MKFSWKSVRLSSQAAGVIVSVLSLIFGSLFSWAQLRQAKTAELREVRQQELTYVLETAPSQYLYQITTPEAQLEIAAPALRLSVETGSLQSVTAIVYDGTHYQTVGSCLIRRSRNDCFVDNTAVPLETPLTDGQRAYDYFFLYLEPMTGDPVLDLVCNTIDLETLEVQTTVSHRLSLLMLDPDSSSPQQVMLQAYQSLYEDLKKLPA